ncbi:uncharacterized protein K02A2.6-like, partial [Stegodyphus dumicola]|uniref:uncharacterized protein K02A2.6-like n=1 Tax=Stegodyphus dumicola TaxID=202533 RepID=UPI0015B153A9
LLFQLFEISKLPDTRSQTVISSMKSHFARYGIPLIVISDYGPQFASKEFAEFAKKYQFKHITSSSYHPRSNGLAERSVQTAKKLLKKAQADHVDPYLALLAHRNTPTNEMLGSPAQRLMSRRTRTILPTSEELLKPQKSYYDRHTKTLPSLNKGDCVRVYQDNRWKPAVVEEVHKTPRSYILRSGGSVLRRNRKDIRENGSAVEENIRGTEQGVNAQKTDVKGYDSRYSQGQSLEDQLPNSANSETRNVELRTRSERVIRKPARYLD